MTTGSKQTSRVRAILRGVKDVPEAFIIAASEELAAMLPHHRATAERRLAYLARFWVEDQKQGGKGRCKTRERVAAALTKENPGSPVSVKAMERAETTLRRRGVAGLAGIRSGEAALRSSGFGRVTDKTAALLAPQLEALANAGPARQAESPGAGESAERCTM